MEYYIHVVLVLLHMWVSWSAVLQIESAGASVCVLHWQQYCRLAAFVRLEVFTVMLLYIQAFLDVMLCCWQVVPGLSSSAGIIPVKTSSKCDSKLNFSKCSWCFVCATLHSSCECFQFNCMNIIPSHCKKWYSQDSTVGIVTRLWCRW